MPNESTLWTKNHLESVRCNLCGLERSVRLCIRLDGILVVRCPRCGLMFCSPRPSRKTLHDQYQGGYMTHDHSASSIGLGRDYLPAQETQLASEDNYWTGILRNLRELLVHAGKILDVGCSAGFFLANAERTGWEPYGLDLSEEAVEYARTRLRLKDVFLGTLDTVPLPRGFLDAVLMHNVIEHFFDPKSELEKARALLKPKGVLCVSTGNSLLAPLLRGRYSEFRAYFEHLYYFTPATLRAMLAETGFVVEVMQFHSLSFSTTLTRQIGSHIAAHSLPPYLQRPAECLRGLWRRLNRWALKIPARFGYSRSMTCYARRIR